MDRVILHCDLNNFYASVETVLNPSLADKYIAVCGSVDNRHGIVLAKNTKAKQMGVKTGTAIWEARLVCPQLTVVEPHGNYYSAYSLRVREIYRRYTDQVESFGLDECWLDVTNSQRLFGNGKAIADRIRNDVKNETGLTISVGVSFNKIFSKLGSDLKKPDATTVIDRNNFARVVYPLNVDSLLMIGPKTTQALRQLGIETVGDLATADDTLLRKRFGINGTHIKAYACGLEDGTVNKSDYSRTVKSVGHGTTTKVDMSDYKTAKQTLYALSEMVATRLRRYSLKANLVSLDLRFFDLTHNSHQTCIASPTFSALLIGNTGFELLKQMWNPARDKPIRTITISTSKLIDVSCNCEQMGLFDTMPRKMEEIEKSVDKVRDKYGYTSLKRALLLENSVMTDKYCSEEDLLPFKRG